MNESTSTTTQETLVRGDVLERYAAQPRRRHRLKGIDPEHFGALRWPIVGALIALGVLLSAGLLVRVPLETPAVVVSAEGSTITVMTSTAHDLAAGTAVEIASGEQDPVAATVTEVPDANHLTLESASASSIDQTQTVTISNGSIPVLLALVQG